MSAPFDSLAAGYDAAFTELGIGLSLRRAVWRRLDALFSSGDRVLELACGTGEDAIHLAERGIHVLATDASQEMVRVAREKMAQGDWTELVEVRQLAFEELESLDAAPFDGVLSDFGGLNCAADLASVAKALSLRTRPGGIAVLCVMGPLVPWEWAWFLGHGQLAKMFRRLTRGGVDWRGLRIRYPSIRATRRAFSPAFRMRRVSALGVFLPPSYAEGWAARHPRLLDRLDRWERRLEIVPPLPWLADHYLIELERT